MRGEGNEGGSDVTVSVGRGLLFLFLTGGQLQQYPTESREGENEIDKIDNREG